MRRHPAANCLHNSTPLCTCAPAQVGRAMYAKAGQLGLPVGYMPFKGFLLHADEIEQLLVDCPGTKAVIDHFGFCKCSDLQSPEWQRLLGLAKYPQVGGFCGGRGFRVKGLGFRGYLTKPHQDQPCRAQQCLLPAAEGTQAGSWLQAGSTRDAACRCCFPLRVGHIPHKTLPVCCVCVCVRCSCTSRPALCSGCRSRPTRMLMQWMGWRHWCRRTGHSGLCGAVTGPG